MRSLFRITQEYFDQLNNDENIILLCGTAKRDNQIIFMVHSIYNGPLSKDIINKAIEESWAICLLTSTKNSSIAEFEDITVIELSINSKQPEASYVLPGKQRETIDQIMVVGTNLSFFYKKVDESLPSHMDRHSQIFGTDTTSTLKKLKVGIVGASGTGSFTIEMLARNGIGGMVVVDDGTIKETNLNRIVNAKYSDIGRLKVDLALDSIRAIGFGTNVETIPLSALHERSIKALSTCDILFGCVDSAEGRFILNLISSFYLIPYFDVGVALESDGKGGIDQVCGGVHYIIPGQSSLLSRKLITPEQLEAEGLKRLDPTLYQDLLKESYIKGLDIQSPAVISLNSFFSSMMINEFLARIHPYRDDDNSKFNAVCYSLSQDHRYSLLVEEKPCKFFASKVGKGDVSPLLERVELS